jgi:WD40 repeat protein
VGDGVALVSRPAAKVEPSVELAKGFLAWRLAWSPDGRRLAAAGTNNELRVWDMATCQQLKSWRDHEGGVRGVAWSPNGQELATFEEGGNVRIRNFETGATRLQVKVETGRSHANLAWSPDGRWLATARDEGMVEVWDASTGERLHHLPLPGCALAIAPDSRSLACGFAQGAVHIADVAGKQERSRFRAGIVGFDIDWSPRGDVVAAANRNGRIELFDAARGKPLAKHIGMRSEVLSVTWSPDGRRLAALGNDETIVIWDAATLDRLLTLPAPGSVNVIRWSPDGRRIAGCGRGGVRVWGSPDMPQMPKDIDVLEGGALSSLQPSENE